jgi:WD40 repeat protein
VVRPPVASANARELSRPAVTLDGFAHPVVGVALAPDGATAFTGELDGTVRRWDLATRRGDRLFDPKNPDLHWNLRGLHLAPGGTDLVAFSYKKVMILDARTGEPKQTVKVLRNIWSAAVSADGRWLALGHDTASGPHNQGSDLAVTLYDVPSGGRAAYWTAPVGVRVAVAFGPDGTSVLAVDADGRVAVLDPAKSAVPAVWTAAAPGERVVGLVPAVSGRVSAVVERETDAGGSGGSATRRLVCRVLDPATGAVVGEMAAAEHAGWSATAAGGSADGRVGAVGTSAGDLLIGGPAVGAPVPRAAHPGRVGCAAVSADGRKVISAGDDERLVKVWDVPLSAAER